jgi:hypothetical protein
MHILIIAIPGNDEHLYGFIFKIDNIDFKNTPGAILLILLNYLGKMKAYTSTRL